MTKPTLVNLPRTNIGQEISKALRNMADEIDKLEAGAVTNIVWIIDYDGDFDIGLLGEAPDPLAKTYLMLGLAQRWVEANG